MLTCSLPSAQHNRCDSEIGRACTGSAQFLQCAAQPALFTMQVMDTNGPLPWPEGICDAWEGLTLFWARSPFFLGFIPPYLAIICASCSFIISSLLLTGPCISRSTNVWKMQARFAQAPPTSSNFHSFYRCKMLVLTPRHKRTASWLPPLSRGGCSILFWFLS